MNSENDEDEYFEEDEQNIKTGPYVLSEHLRAQIEKNKKSLKKARIDLYVREARKQIKQLSETIERLAEANKNYLHSI